MQMTEILYEEISKTAYYLYEKRGRVPGHDVEDWIEAEKIVMKKQGRREARRASVAEPKVRVQKKAQKKAVAGKKKALNRSFMKPMQISDALAQVVGAKPIPRTEVTKRLWAYIKKTNLQDSADRRLINADDKLRTVFGNRKQISMFEMTRLINKHLS